MKLLRRQFLLLTAGVVVLDECVGEDNPVRTIDVFVDGLDLAELGFDGVSPLATGPASVSSCHAVPGWRHRTWAQAHGQRVPQGARQAAARAT